jgi:signal transduction histidine kinase
MNHFIRDCLSSEYRTEYALDGKAGFRKALELRPDLILSDIMMPQMSGATLIREIRSRPELQFTPIILLTAKADDDLRIRLLREGANDYVTKPFSVEELRARVRNLISIKLTDEQNRRLSVDLKERYEHLQRVTASLETANKQLEAFSYSVSHDLRAPLRSIDGFSMALLEDCGELLSAEGRDHLRRVRDAAQRMGTLIDDLLQLALVTRAELRTEEVDLSNLARSIIADLRQLQPGRAVEFTVAEGLTARGDRGLLRTVLENLLGNAWKFTSKRPITHIEFGSTETQEDGRVTYFVRDNGAGFDMGYAEKLFGAFQRLHTAPEFPGTGVGLAIVQRIIQRHSGSVWAEGKVDGGATFYFTL